MSSPERAGPSTREPSSWSGYSTGWSYLATMISGLIAWGGIGLVADLLLDLRWLFLPVGMVLGMAGGIYLAQRRYGGGWKA
jgi:hypothetical protein